MLRAAEQEKMQIEAAKQAEIEYDRRIRQNMLAMAEQDKVRRMEDTERRKREAEMRLQAEAERRAREEELRRQAEERLRAERASAAARAAAEEARRAEEAHANRQAWDEQERRRAEAKLAELPQWQQRLVASKRQQQS